MGFFTTHCPTVIKTDKWGTNGPTVKRHLTNFCNNKTPKKMSEKKLGLNLAVLHTIAKWLNVEKLR